MPEYEAIDFGFLLTRVMYFYSETYESVMRMPLRTFWLLSNNVERIQAQIDLRTMQLNLRTGFGATEQAVKQMHEVLIAETGEVVKTSAKAQLHAPRDQQGFEELRAMAQHI